VLYQLRPERSFEGEVSVLWDMRAVVWAVVSDVVCVFWGIPRKYGDVIVRASASVVCRSFVRWV
jgi:hypothetical protein